MVSIAQHDLLLCTNLARNMYYITVFRHVWKVQHSGCLEINTALGYALCCIYVLTRPHVVLSIHNSRQCFNYNTTYIHNMYGVKPYVCMYIHIYIRKYVLGMKYVPNQIFIHIPKLLTILILCTCDYGLIL